MTSLVFATYTGIVVLLGAIIAVFLVKRRLIRTFPMFSAYIVYSTLDSLIRLGTLWRKGPLSYFDIYWYSEIGEIVLALFSMMESLFVMYAEFGRSKWFRTLVWTSAFLAVLYGVWKAIAQPPQAAPWIVSIVVSTELLFQYWLISIGVLFFALALLLGDSLQQRECLIVFGFLAQSLLIVIGFLLRSIFGMRFLVASTILPSLAYVLGMSIWLVAVGRRNESFWSPASLPRLSIEHMTMVMDRYIGSLQRLTKLLSSASRISKK